MNKMLRQIGSSLSSSKKAPVKIVVYGCLGRVGRRLCSLICDNQSFEFVGAIASAGNENIGRLLTEIEPTVSKTCRLVISGPSVEEFSTNLPKPDVIVDFSSPEGTMSCVSLATALGVPVVIGTTGLTQDQEAVIQAATERIGVIHAMNYSLGVNLLIQLVGDVARSLGDTFDVEIVETHHNKKVDAPSGTALALADSICVSLDRTRENLINGRKGITGKRGPKEIGVHAVRLGNVIGDHTVHFASDFERIELTHRSQNRDVFVTGALRAAEWLAGQPPGRYSMTEVLSGS